MKKTYEVYKNYKDSIGNVYKHDEYGWYVASINTHMNPNTGDYDDDDLVYLPDKVMRALIDSKVLEEI